MLKNHIAETFVVKIRLRSISRSNEPSHQCHFESAKTSYFADSMAKNKSRINWPTHNKIREVK
jgi:hypothetical protein